MKKAGIAIDEWKLPIFKRHLSQAGYSYEQGAGVTQDSLFLYVKTDDMQALHKVVLAANTEASGAKSCKKLH